MIIRLTVFLFCLLFSVSAYAEDYAEVSLLNFVHTLVRFKAIDVNDDTLLDDYALITDCDLVENFYENDFRWGQVRQLMRDSIKINVNTFPTAYRYDTTLKLARYDFKNRNFRFTDETALRSVNTFNFIFTSKNGGNKCNGHSPANIPTVYNMVIGTPVSINGLPLSEDDAKTLLSRLESADNTDRIIYVRFNMTVVFIDPLKKSMSSGLTLYSQNAQGGAAPLRIDARLDSVEFFEDHDHTKKLYSFTP